MKRCILIIWMILSMVALVTAQTTNARICTEQDIPAIRRPNYIRFAKQFIENYYATLLFNVGNPIIQETFITNTMSDNSQRYQPEFLRNTPTHVQHLSPASYIIELNKEFKNINIEDVTLEASEVQILKDFYAPNMVSCYVIAEYMLTLKYASQTLYKRKCRAYCLFPSAADWITVRLMQVEPVQDIIAYKSEEKPNPSKPEKEQPNKKAYDISFAPVNGYSIIIKGTKRGFIDGKTLQVVIEPQYDDVQNFYEGVAAAQKNGKWGYIDTKGNVVVDFKYESASPVKNGKAEVYEYRKGIFSISIGNKKEPAKTESTYQSQITKRKNVKYDFKYNPSGGYQMVSSNRLYGFINPNNGEEIATPIYDNARNFSEGMAAVCVSSSWGFIDTNGKLIVRMKYDGVEDFKGGKATVYKGDYTITIDKTGKEIRKVKTPSNKKVVTPKYGSKKAEQSEPVSYISSTTSNQYAKSNTPKRKNVKYDVVNASVNGYSIVTINKRKGLMNASTKEEIVTPIYDDVTNFYDGMAAVKLSNSWGYVDMSGQVVIPLKFEEAYSFNGGKAKVKYNGKYIYINKQGSQVK